MQGQLNDGRNGTAGVRFASSLKILSEAGTVSKQGNTLRVRGATAVVLLLTADTDMQELTLRSTDDPESTATAALDAASTKSWEQLQKRHTQDYWQYYDRVRLRLSAANRQLQPEQPIHERLTEYWETPRDNSLAELYFNFGRYILISSSRPGGRPANLQGLWAEELQTPWNGDWHLNINVQMNYWPAEVCSD